MINELPDDLKSSYGKEYRICRDNGLLTKRRKSKCIEKSDPQAQKSDDLVQRNFYSDKPGEKVFTDITKMACNDGKLYYCGILDACDGAQIGYSMEDHMRTELFIATLMNAKRRYGPHVLFIVTEAVSSHRIGIIRQHTQQYNGL